ncbi:hypothetical protein [Nostoc sp.]|uniref:hypothetical protein n=1 Tax=Nostoc sp. TaxID=1180 RepID=UPI002FFAA947
MKPNKTLNMLGFVPQTAVASSRRSRRQLLQVGKAAQRTASPTYTFLFFGLNRTVLTYLVPSLRLGMPLIRLIRK